MKTKLSVNLNKVALIRNSRGNNLPDLVRFALDCELYGADGITLHPRPDERHAKYADVPALKAVIKTELNVEGYPNDRFLGMVLKNKPAQCTLVPDLPGVLTSDSGWDTVKNAEMLKEIIRTLRVEGIRVSLFVDPIEEMIEGAKLVGADRVELYTGEFANGYSENREKAVEPFVRSAEFAIQVGIGVNAGHDLNLDNLAFFIENVPEVKEVSIGHALVSDALYYGIQNTVGMYQAQILKGNSKRLK